VAKKNVLNPTSK